ncbi:hypothetical protein RFI_10781, partial [Reticulomyxa filosa]
KKKKKNVTGEKVQSMYEEITASQNDKKNERKRKEKYEEYMRYRQELIELFVQFESLQKECLRQCDVVVAHVSDTTTPVGNDLTCKSPSPLQMQDHIASSVNQNGDTVSVSQIQQHLNVDENATVQPIQMLTCETTIQTKNEEKTNNMDAMCVAEADEIAEGCVAAAVCDAAAAIQTQMESATKTSPEKNQEGQFETVGLTTDKDVNESYEAIKRVHSDRNTLEEDRNTTARKEASANNTEPSSTCSSTFDHTSVNAQSPLLDSLTTQGENGMNDFFCFLLN